MLTFRRTGPSARSGKSVMSSPSMRTEPFHGHEATEVLDQNALSSSRSTKKAESFSPVDLQVDPPQDVLPSEALMKIPHFNKGLFFFGHGETRW